MKQYLFMMALLASVFSFSACSDDEDIDVAQLEGTWFLVSEEGYYYENGNKHEENNQYDPSNLTEDSQKMTISKTKDNTYIMVDYYFYNNKWNQSSSSTEFKLDGTNIIPVDETDVTGSMKILIVNSEQLVVESKGTDEDGDYYGKVTYKRM